MASTRPGKPGQLHSQCYFIVRNTWNTNTCNRTTSVYYSGPLVWNTWNTYTCSRTKSILYIVASWCSRVWPLLLSTMRGCANHKWPSSKWPAWYRKKWIRNRLAALRPLACQWCLWSWYILCVGFPPRNQLHTDQMIHLECCILAFSMARDLCLSTCKWYCLHFWQGNSAPTASTISERIYPEMQLVCEQMGLVLLNGTIIVYIYTVYILYMYIYLFIYYLFIYLLFIYICSLFIYSIYIYIMCVAYYIVPCFTYR